MSVAVAHLNGEEKQPSIMQMIAAMSSDDRVNPEKMQALIAMHERHEAREAEKEFNRAFAAMSELLPRVTKKGLIKMGDKGNIAFAKYEDVDKVLKPIEAQHGFTRSFSSDVAPGAVLMIITLRHCAGHSISSRMQLPPDPGPGRNALQAMGSSRSYGKRYLTLDIWNIITEGADDDGAGTSKIGEREIQSIEDMFAACGMVGDSDPSAAASRKVFFGWAGVSRIADIQKSDYPKVMRGLQDKLRKVQEGR